jgi:hypothetical protein
MRGRVWTRAGRMDRPAGDALRGSIAGQQRCVELWPCVERKRQGRDQVEKDGVIDLDLFFLRDGLHVLTRWGRTEAYEPFGVFKGLRSNFPIKFVSL